MSNESLDKDEKAVSETVTPQPAPDRRRLLRKLATLAGLGITGALLSQTKTGLLPTVGAFATAGDIGFADGSGGTSYSDNFRYITPRGFLSVANVEWSEAPILASSRSGDVVGATLTLDSTNATAGNKYSIISTGSDAEPGGGFLGVYNDTAAFYPFVIGPTGKVGIGTKSPSKLLHILGNTVIPGTGLAENLRVESSTAEVGIGLNNTSAAGHLWYITSTGTNAIEGTGQLGFYDNTANAWRMTLDSLGNVGIGTTHPLALLHVSGSNPNIILGDSSNKASGGGATVSGGFLNAANGPDATVGGGYANKALNSNATVGGGNNNQASGTEATVSGGSSNQATGNDATVGGGFGNVAGGGMETTVGGGVGNVASGNIATVGGGISNTASGLYSTVPGGSANLAAGDFSFAAGRRAKVGTTPSTHNGTFLFADSSNFDFKSAGPNEFAARCTGGARFVSGVNGSGTPIAGVTLAPGGGSWSSISDRGLKENFAELDGMDLLERLSSLPISEWNYKAQDKSIRHIGPMAQDFFSAFHVGEDNRHISTVDVDGVALVSIQALYAMVKELDVKTEKIGDLETRLQALERTVKPSYRIGKR